jgi:hypothetical protein
MARRLYRRRPAPWLGAQYAKGMAATIVFFPTKVDLPSAMEVAQLR